MGNQPQLYRHPGARLRRAIPSLGCAFTVGVLAWFAFPAAATATTTTIADDSIPVGTAIPQFPSVNPEITFAQPSSFGFAVGSPANGVVATQACGGAPLVEAAAVTNSPPNAEEMGRCGSVEFPFRGDFAVLTDFANSVSAFVGDATAAGERFELDAYDINGHLIGSSTVTTPGAGFTTKIQFDVLGGAFTIAYVALYDTGGGTDHFIGMDDLTVVGCTPGSTCNPEISLSSAAGGQLSQGSQAQYTVSLVRHNGSNGNVSVNASGLGLGIHPSFSPTLISATNTTSSLTITIDATAPLGSSTGTITATPVPGAGDIAQSVPVTVQVVAPFGVYVGLSSTQPASTSISVPPCETAAVGVRTLLGPAFTGTPINVAVTTNGDTSDVSSVSLSKPSLNNPSDFDLSGENDQILTVSRNGNQTSSNSFQIDLAPTSGSFTEPTAIVDVTRAPAVVNSIDTTFARTPQDLNPGTELTIKGAGFCPGSTVQFGNPQAIATPDSISADGTMIKVQTPPLATDGPVTVLTAGQRPTSGQSLTVDSYRNVNGYQFHNYRPHITFDQMTEAFGSDQTYDSIPLCIIDCTVTFRDPFAMILNAIANAAFGGSSGGACFGFSLSSQRFLEGQASLSDYPPGSASQIFGLDSKSARSGQITEFINAMQASQLSVEFLGHWLGDASSHLVNGGASSSHDVFNQITGALSQGRFPLIALRDGGEGHVVIAYNVEGAPPDWFVDVYDSNDPFNWNGDENSTTDGSTHQTQFQNSRIHIDSDGNWSLPSSNLSGDMSGLVVTDPANLPNPPTIVSNLAKIATLGYILFGSSTPPDTTGTSAAGPPPSAVTQVTDQAGHTLFDAHGNLSSNPAGRIAGTMFAPLVGEAGRTAAARIAAQPPFILLPASATAFRETVADQGAGPDTHVILGRGFTAQIVTNSRRGADDGLTVDPNGAGFATSAASKPLDLTLIASAGRARRVAEVSTTSFGGGGDTLRFTGGRSGLELAHKGKPTTFTITLSGLDNHHAPETFKSGPLHIGPGGKASIGAINWGSLQGSTIELTIGGRRLRIANRLRAPQLASIARLSATKLRGHAVSLTIATRPRRLPAGTQVVFLWIVKQGARRIASHLTIAGASTKSATFTFRARQSGRYKLTAYVTVATLSGVAQSSSSAVRTVAFRL